MRDQSKRPFLYVVVCAAGVAGDVGTLITAAQERHWDVGVVATPYGLGFIDQPAIEARTGHPVRSAWRKPGDARPLPPADAIAVAPATFNTVNKWAAGISDTLALGILCEAYGLASRSRSCRTSTRHRPPTPRTPRAWNDCAEWAS